MGNPINIESSLLNSADYNEDSNTLEVEFKNGSTYKYENIPIETYNQFINAESKGKFFSKNIRPLGGVKKVQEPNG